MGCALQIGLFLLGAWLLSRSRVRIGVKELLPPSTIFAGIILALQLPISIGVGFALGGAEGIKAAREGQERDVALAKAQKKYWWLDLAVPGVALAAAGAVIAAGMRDPLHLPPPPDDPVGITDFRAVRSEQWETERRAERLRNQKSDEPTELSPWSADGRLKNSSQEMRP